MAGLVEIGGGTVVTDVAVGLSRGGSPAALLAAACMAVRLILEGEQKELQHTNKCSKYIECNKNTYQMLSLFQPGSFLARYLLGTRLVVAAADNVVVVAVAVVVMAVAVVVDTVEVVVVVAAAEAAAAEASY